MQTFKKYFEFSVEAEIIYAALTNEATIMLWTGNKAIMKAEPNTEFSLFDDQICGMNLEFEPNKKIVQEWYFGEQENPSIVTIKLHTVKSKTSIEVVQTNIPNEAFEDITQGWIHHYMGALQDFYSEG